VKKVIAEVEAAKAPRIAIATRQHDTLRGARP
jgi:hypothetical protein